jgi:hypothetical protein
MPTLQEQIALLPPDQQRLVWEQLNRQAEYHRAKEEMGSLLFHTAQTGRGVGHGFANALYGLATLPTSLTNWLGLTDADWARKNLIGTNSLMGVDSPLNRGPAYAIGNLGGFLGSLAVPGGVAKGGASLLGKTLPKAASYALAPEMALARVVGESRVGQALPSLGQKALHRGTEFSLLSAARTPGDVPERVTHGMHSFLPGAVFGMAGRMRGIRMAPTKADMAAAERAGTEVPLGKLVTGRDAEAVLTQHGGYHQALLKGILDKRAPKEPMSPVHLFQPGDWKKQWGFIPASVARGFVAGGLSPGFAPVEISGNPFLDSALFNSMFFGVMGVSQTTPHIPVRRKAQEIDRLKTQKTVEDLGTPTIPVPPDTAWGRYPKRGPVSDKDVVGAVSEQPDLPFGAGEVGPAKPPAEARPIGRETKPITDLATDAMAETGLGWRALQNVPEPDLLVAPTGRPYHDINVVLGKLSRGGYTKAHFAPDITESMGLPRNKAVPIKGFVEKAASADTITATESGRFLKANIEADLAATPRRFFPNRSLGVLDSGGPRTMGSRWAEVNHAASIMTVYPSYFSLPKWMRRVVLTHELSHSRTLWTRIGHIPAQVVAEAYTRAGFPARVVPGSRATPAGRAEVMNRLDAMREVVAEEAMNQFYYKTAQPKGAEQLPLFPQRVGVSIERMPFLGIYYPHLSRPNLIQRYGRRGGAPFRLHLDNDTHTPWRQYQDILEVLRDDSRHVAWAVAGDPAANRYYFMPVEFYGGWGDFGLAAQESRGLGYGRLMAAAPPREFLRGMDPMHRIAGRHYGWGNPREFAAEMTVELALRGRENMEAHRPGSTEFFKVVLGEHAEPYIQGVTNIRDELVKQSEGQADLFGKEEYFGPGDLTVGWEISKRPGPPERDAKLRDAMADEHTKGDKFLFAWLSRYDTDSARIMEVKKLATGGSDLVKGKLATPTKEATKVAPLEGAHDLEKWRTIEDAAIDMWKMAETQGRLEGLSDPQLVEAWANIIRQATALKEAKAPIAGTGEGGLDVAQRQAAETGAEPTSVWTALDNLPETTAEAAAKNSVALPVERQLRTPHNYPLLAQGLTRAFERGAQSLADLISNNTRRQVVLMKYGGAKDAFGQRIYKNLDGTPIYDHDPMTHRAIADYLGVSVTTVKNHIAKFIEIANRDLPIPSTYMFEPPKLRPKGLQEYLPPQTPPPEPATTTHKWYRFRDPRGTTKRIRAPKVVETKVGEDVVERAFFERTDPKDARVLPAGIQYSRGGDVARTLAGKEAEVPTRSLPRQASFWQSREFVRQIVADERAAGIERAADAELDPPPQTPEGQAIVDAATEAATLEALVERKATDTGKQLDFQRYMRQQGLKVAEHGFPSPKRKAPIFKTTGAALYFSARAKLGKGDMTAAEFDTLNLHDQIRHAIFRLSTASGMKHWGATLKKYAGITKKHKGKFLGRYPSKYPIFLELAKKAKISGRRVTNRGDLFGVLNDGTAKLHLDMHPIARPLAGRGRFSIREEDTGITYNVVDMGTAALIMDARTRRLATAPDLSPPGLEGLFIKFPPGQGGPRVPRGADYGQDAEHSGIPPDTVVNRADDMMIWGSRIRAVQDVANSATLVTGDQRIATGTRLIINGYAKVREHTLEFKNQMERLAARHGVKAKDRFTIAKVNAIWDETAAAIKKDRGEAAAQEYLKTEAITEAKHFISDHQIRFLVAARPLWDKAGKRFGIGEDKYEYGYFSRWEPQPQKDIGTILRGGDVGPGPDFWAAYRRTGNKGYHMDYFEVFEHYVRSGFKQKFLGTEPGSPTLGPWEYLEKVMFDYGITRGNMTGGPTWMAPIKAAYLRSQGAIDPGQARAHQVARGRTRKLLKLTKKANNALDYWELGPMRDTIRPVLERAIKGLEIKLERRDLNSLIDLFLVLNRGRTFGLHAMRAIRHLTQSWFFVLPRVGPKAFGQAIRDMLDEPRARQVIARARASGALKQPFPEEFITTRSRFLRGVEKLSFLYRKLDVWERAISFRAQEILIDKAMARWKKNTHQSFDEKWENYIKDTNLDLLHPAYRGIVRDYMQRGQFVSGKQQHAAILVDHTIFDYTRINMPLWAGGSVWGRFFGQYGRWPLAAAETMFAMANPRYGSPMKRAMAWGWYGAVAATVYGMGQAFGVQTGEWIPFVHSLGYSGGPGLSLADDFLDVLSGEPTAQDEFIHNLTHDPVYTILGAGFKYGVPLGDVLEALAAETNLSRRRRRLAGIPGTALTDQEFTARLMGFRPTSDPTDHHKLITYPFEWAFQWPARKLREAAGTE